MAAAIVTELTDEEAKIKQQEIDAENAKKKDEATLSFTETDEELDIRIQFNFKIRVRDVAVEMKKTHLKAGLKGKPPVIDGDTYDDVKKDDSAWTIDGNELQIQLGKVDKKKWNRILKTDPVVSTDTKKGMTGISDIDPEIAKSMLEKMMAGKKEEPTSDPVQKAKEREEAIEKLKKDYPGIDLAKCTFSED